MAIPIKIPLLITLMKHHALLSLAISAAFSCAPAALWAQTTFEFRQAKQGLVVDTNPGHGSLSLPSGLVFGASPFVLSAPTSKSAGSWTYTSSNPAVATVSGSTVTVTGAGSTTVTASQAAASPYAAASVSAELVVARAVASVGAFSVASPLLIGQSVTVTAPSSPSQGTWSYASSNPSVVAVSGSQATAIGPGTAVITATQAPTSNYSSASASATVLVNNPVYATFRAGVANTILSDGGLYVRSGNGGSQAAVDTTVAAKSAGKWYWEIKTPVGISGCSFHEVGVASGTFPRTRVLPQGVALASGGAGIRDSYGSLNGPSYVGLAGTWVGIALDMDARQVTFYGEGVSYGPYALAATGVYTPAAAVWGEQAWCGFTANFGQSPFVRAVPAGFNKGWY